MNELTLVKSEMFDNVQCDFYSNEDVICMTSEQLGMALDYADPATGIHNIVTRNPYLREKEFSTTINMIAVDGKAREMRVFTEDGIYEVTMLAKTEKAKTFRAFVRKTLKGLRTGQLQVVQPSENLGASAMKYRELEIKARNAEARERNAKTRQATLLLKERDKSRNILSMQAVELLTIDALEIITGKNTLPRPALPDKLYSATEIAEEIGTSSNMVGRMAIQNKLKTPEYGMYVLDDKKYSKGQTQVFKYNEKGRQELIRLLKMKLSK